MTGTNGRVKQPRLTPRTDIADAFARTFWEDIVAYVESRVPTFGTVAGRDAGKGNVRVHIDEEREPRQVGFPRAKGTEYQDGDRVLLVPNRAGTLTVAGTVTSGGGANAERGVGRDQLMRDAVDGEALGQAVVDTGHVKDRSITNSKLDQGLQSKIADSISSQQVDNKLSGYARSNELNAFAKSSEVDKKADKSEIDRLDKKIKELETKINRMSSKKDKKGGA